MHEVLREQMIEQIKAAANANPLYEVAKDLVAQGYDERIIKELEKADPTFPDQVALTLSNYMRDIKHCINTAPIVWR